MMPARLSNLAANVGRSTASTREYHHAAAVCCSRKFSDIIVTPVRPCLQIDTRLGSSISWKRSSRDVVSSSLAPCRTFRSYARSANEASSVITTSSPVVGAPGQAQADAMTGEVTGQADIDVRHVSYERQILICLYRSMVELLFPLCESNLADDKDSLFSPPY
jgi:hypothetical protein